MPGKARCFDLVIGISFLHFIPSCPTSAVPFQCIHPVVGFLLTGSYMHLTNGIPTAQAPGSIVIHSCPHCGIGMALAGSLDTITGGIGTLRQGDVGLMPCGVFTVVTGSPDSIANG